jgi:hypothetical protein
MNIRDFKIATISQDTNLYDNNLWKFNYTNNELSGFSVKINPSTENILIYWGDYTLRTSTTSDTIVNHTYTS